MLSWFTGIQAWLWMGAIVIILALAGVFIWRGYEIDSLSNKLQAAQNSALEAQQQVKIISQVRDQELKSQQEANKRADEIRKIPEKDNGPVAPVLADSLRRL